MNFNEQAFVERLLKAESAISGLVEGQSKLLTKIKAVEKSKNPSSKHDPKYDKIKLVNDLIFYVESLKIKFTRDKIYIEKNGVEYYESEDIEYEMHMIQEVSKALYDED